VGLPPRYLDRYQARLREAVKRLRSELEEHRRVLKLEYRAESRTRTRQR
jgi:hypothetical protein